MNEISKSNFVLENESNIPGNLNNIKDVIKNDTPQISTLPKNSNIFKIFIIISVIIIIIIYSSVLYLFLQNKKIKSDNQNLVNETPTLTPTPSISSDQFKIKNGNIIREITKDNEVVLVDKNNFSSTGITGFAKLNISPNLNKICFESIPPAPKPGLYLSNIDGSNVIEVNPNRQNCLWSQDSNSIFYLNTYTKISPVNIYIYKLSDNSELNITKPTIPEGYVRQYQIIGFSSDKSKLICSYKDLNIDENLSKDCEVDLSTYDVTFL